MFGLRTIRSKMMFVFAASLLSVCVLSVFHFANLYSLRTKFLLSERIDDMSNDILELRRYEKNFLFYNDPQSLGEGLEYLGRIDGLIDEMGPDIGLLLGQARFGGFQSELKRYGAILRAFHEGAPLTQEQRDAIRATGKALTDVASELSSIKRGRIHAAIRQTLALPFAFLTVFLLLTVLVVALVYLRVLRPLAVLRETTRRVAQGDFRPIAFDDAYHDEITDLIGAFNLMAKELEANQEHLVQARKMAALGTFTAGVAHELNNPINNISLTVEGLLEEHAQSLDPDALSMMDDIMSQAERAGEIVRNLLDFSRTERPVFKAISLEEVLRQTLALIKNQIRLAGVESGVSISQGLPQVLGDAAGLRQVFMNLMLNAIQAMPRGGSLQVSAGMEGPDRVRVDVRDTGLGMTQEMLQHIFEPFYTTKEAGKGTGLGLSVCYSLVKRHGGRIEVSSTLGEGTVFSVLLPVGQPETGPEAAEEA